MEMVAIQKDDKVLAFPESEYLERLKRVRHVMEQRNIEALLVHTPENILYLTGYHTPGYYAYQCLIVTLVGEQPILLIRNGEVGNVHAYSWLSECATYFDNQDSSTATAELLVMAGLGSARVAVEKNSWFLRVDTLEAVVDKLPGLSVTDGSGTVEACRVIKSPREVEYIRQAARTAEAGMSAGIEAVRPGQTDNDIAAAVSEAMIAAGSEYPALGPFVATGRRSSIMHGIWGRNPVEKGDSIILEVGGVINRYNGALMRTVSVGEPSSELRAMAAASEAANSLLIEHVRAGAMTKDLHAICMGELEAHGYGGTRRGRRCGYGIGLAFAPDWGEGHIVSIIDEPNTRLESGMVFHLPLSVRVYGRYGASFSETILVTDSGCEKLTNFERRLFVR